MKTRFQWVWTGLAGFVLAAGVCSVASAHAGAGGGVAAGRVQGSQRTAALVSQVVQATARYRDVAVAEADGYVRTWGCVSNDNAGAMGIHFINSALLGDGEVDLRTPEALVFEPTPDGLQLAAVEYVTFKENWDANHPGTPPALLGQLFFYMGEPNRFEIPAAYSLHVWAFKPNPNGLFAAWNPDVKCGGAQET